MQSKFGLVALSVMASLVLFGGDTAEAKAKSTDKTKDKSVVVKVNLGDTLSSIADKKDTTYLRLFYANKTIKNPDIINVGDKVRIPLKDEKLKKRPLPSNVVVATAAPTAPAAQATAQVGTQSAPTSNASVQPVAVRGAVAGNSYYWGQCTWYVKNVRPDLPNNLGNGGQWVANAAAMGIPTGSTPRVGAVAEEPGHVAYVEAVNGNMITISEMNYAGNVGKRTVRTVPASNYRFIY